MASRRFAAAGLFLVTGGVAALAVTGHVAHHRAFFFVFYGAAALGYLLLLRHAPAVPRRAALVLAIALRLAFLPVAPSLSDDVYRYIWDGRVQASGIDPYLYTPADPRLDRVAYAGRSLVNHPQVRTIYPPAAEGLFLAVGGAGGGVLTYRLVFGLFDLLAAAALCLLVDRRRRATMLILYLLCPLTILETWGSAHLEVVSVALVLFSAAMLRRGRDAAAGVALGLAAAFKITPAALVVPALVGRRARLLPFLAAFVPTLALPYVPYLIWDGLGGATGSLLSAGGHQDVNSLVFFALHQILPYGAALAVCAAAAAACLLVIGRRLPGRQATAAAFAWSATVVLLFSPAVHSWYWLAPLALSLAAGLRVPIYLGLAAPAAEVGWLMGGRYRDWAHALGYAPLLAGVRRRPSRLPRPEAAGHPAARHRRRVVAPAGGLDNAERMMPASPSDLTPGDGA